MRKSYLSFSGRIIMAVFLAVAYCVDDSVGELKHQITPLFEYGDSLAVKGVEIFDNIIYFPVLVNGSAPFMFVLDTGAGNLSAFDQGEADMLGVKSTIIGEGGGAGEEIVSFGLTDSVTISLRGLSFENRPLVTVPLRRLDAHWGKRKDGLIGGDLLSTLVTTIDYENAQVVFHDAAAYQYMGPGERIPVMIENNFLMVDAEVFTYGAKDHLDALFMIDTGVRLSTFNSPYSRKHGLAEQSPGTLSGMIGYGMGGAAGGVAGRVSGIRIGSILMEDPVISFSTDNSGILADTSFAGIIGADILSRFTVVFDYSRSEIFLEKNNRFADPFEFDMCGIRFSMDGQCFNFLNVFSVFKDSPAAMAGIESGDIVRKIDGIEAGDFTWEELRDYLRRDGKKVRFTIERDGRLRDVAVRLKRIV
ncbi:MAG: aspartyl protease family protein [Candidatus Krumholzibacteriota bacterium]|nr:aspartyl protease family protein [Candidatus Krumholzibacteriota bacterium]